MHWSGKDILKQTYPENIDVRICAFRMIDDFLVFSLHQTKKNVLEFPKAKLDNAIDVIGRELNPNFVGRLFHNGIVHIWYECETNGDNIPRFVNSSEKKWWALSSEIVNWRSLLHFQIADSVVDLFLENTELLFVEDANKHKLECPIVGYRGGYSTNILKLAIIGISRENFDFASLGHFFYFGDYHSGMRYAFMPFDYEKEMYHAGEKIIRDDGRFLRGGIARFALYTGNKGHTMLLGRIKDRSDKTRNAIKEGVVRSEDAFFRDTEGLWAKTFDSVLLGRRAVISRSSGKKKTLNPQYVIKHFEQHVPLSFHYVNTITQDAENAIIE